ncbi:VOC family protein [Alicyclobacillus sp. ALC3]|uniref:VOC family protein n=1 Tax=Alicyclobacillus sp. ALC3 TaxID=2796143 RepID=UPI002377F621|nr:VOC family protein [Alicyclobacillus sp. ALC3]WDL96457.1 VOC family protein [Alicyclobacillus sp. ALC3]
MMIPSRLFHLHFYVADPEGTERAFVERLGMQVIARYGLVGSKEVRFEPEVGWRALIDAGARFRLTQLKKGTFDLVLGPGTQPEPLLEHFGLRVDEETYELCKRTFVARELAYREGERRSFFTTPFGVRMELVAPHHAVTYPDADHAGLQLEKVRFGVPDPLACERFFADALGQQVLSQLEFEVSREKARFRTVEVQLSSPKKEKNTVFEILPGTRWIF